MDISGATGPGAGRPWRSFANINTALNFIQPHTIQLGVNGGSPVDIRIGAGSFGGLGVGNISGFGNVVKTGTGTLILGNVNFFTGDVEIWGGALSISDDMQLGVPGNNVIMAGGSFTTTASISTARNFFLRSTPQTLGGAAPNANFNQATGTTLVVTGTITDASGFTNCG